MKRDAECCFPYSGLRSPLHRRMVQPERSERSRILRTRRLFGPPAIGRAAITETVQSFMAAFPDLKVIMDQLIVGEDEAEYHWTLTGRNTGPGGTGNPVRISGFERWQFNSERLIAKSQGQFDAEEYNRQLQG